MLTIKKQSALSKLDHLPPLGHAPSLGQTQRSLLHKGLSILQNQPGFCQRLGRHPQREETEGKIWLHQRRVALTRPEFPSNSSKKNQHRRLEKFFPSSFFKILSLIIFPLSVLVACTRLYKALCRLVGRSACRSVNPSARH